METTSLQPMIRRFAESQPSDPLIQEQLLQHERRKEAASRLLDPEHIPSVTRQELQDFLQDMDSWYGLRWNKNKFWTQVFGEADERLPILRETLAELVRRAEAGFTADDFRYFLSELPGVGPSYLSEILGLRFPDRYWLWNKQIRDFFSANGVDIKAELPWGKKAHPGEEYMAAGTHLTDLRRALAQALDQPVDYMLSDLFIYWANQQEQPDPWAEQIARLNQEWMTPERSRALEQAERRARELLEQKLGRFSADDYQWFATTMNTDRSDGRGNRFAGAFGRRGLTIRDLPAFNAWAERIWHAGDGDLDDVLDRFWKSSEVGGAGRFLPTLLLYLRDPTKYNIWLPVSSKGLQLATGFSPVPGHSASSYRHYNAAMIGFRERHHLLPQALDHILWRVATGAGREAGDEIFPGFTEGTFAFLQELEANNSAEWMHRDGDSNEIRFRQVLREPLRLLFQGVAPTIARLDPTLETEAKFGRVLAGIKKRFPDAEGPYHTYLWGAFYRKGLRKQADAQLFVNVHPDCVRVGVLAAGAEGSEALARFRRNLQQAPQLFLGLLLNRPPGTRVVVGSWDSAPKVVDVQTLEDLKLLQESDKVYVERRYEADEPILAEPGFAMEVAELHEALYPLFRFATTEDPEQLAADLMEDDESDEDETGGSPYTLEDLCRDTFLEAPFWRETQALMEDKRQIVLYGPPGTGKTWVAQQFARYWVDTAPEARGEVQVVQFHPSYAYEEFVEGIRPQSVKAADGRHELTYPVKKGIFRRFCEQARAHPRRRYVLILDEINRGELPRILGELLYLLEYRQRSVVLPYSGGLFAIPDNVYLIGTMNTADRSIALVDHALRRRFHFVALRASPDVLRAYYESNGGTEMDWVADLLEQANHQLENDGIEWHLHIGHSHFMREDLDDARLRLIWKHSVLPTLEEYFYRQPERLQAYHLDTLKQALGEA